MGLGLQPDHNLIKKITLFVFALFDKEALKNNKIRFFNYVILLGLSSRLSS